MYTYHITLALGLPGVRVVEQTERGDDHLQVVIEPVAPSAVCPRCGRTTRKVHDRRRRPKVDRPLGHTAITLILVRRRFRCLGCDRVFTEPDTVCGWRRHLTTRLREHLAAAARQQTVKQVAESYGVSDATVRRAVEEGAVRCTSTDPPVARCLGIDEFSLRKGQRYATGLHDLDRHGLIDVVEGRTKAQAEVLLERLPAPALVEVVSMDMAQAYRAAVQTVLPQAVIVVDKFHVVARVTEAVRQVWQRLVQGKGRDDPLRVDGRLVLRAGEHLRAIEWERLRALLKAYPLLRRAWLLKEDFRRWYRTATREEAVAQLGAWRRMILAETDLPEFQKLQGMLKEWQEEIVNYFIYRVTQGPVEGTHTWVKAVQRQAFGYRNFNNLRRRLLLVG